MLSATTAGSDDFIKGYLHVAALVKGHSDTISDVYNFLNRKNENDADVRCCIFHLNLQITFCQHVSALHKSKFILHHNK